MDISKMILKCVAGLFVSLSVSCTGLHQSAKKVDIPLQHVSVVQDGTLLSRYAPAFVIEDSAKDFNKIGTAAVRKDKAGQPEVYVDRDHPSIYAMEQKFADKNSSFTNLIYRIHFESTPLPHLTAGKNVGLIIIVTLDQDDSPLLVTTVHTCGCYLSITPTSLLPPRVYPENWPADGQDIYGEYLPSLFRVEPEFSSKQRFVARIRSETHRVMDLDVWPTNPPLSSMNAVTATLEPMSALTKLPFGDTEISFFETRGARKGYVRNSYKPLEKLLMSWWSMDWRVGEDKALGPKEQTGTTFYTSLKFWAREKSDLWNFSKFLSYWGWKL